MKIEITKEEISKIEFALLIASESPKKLEINWGIIDKFLAKTKKK